MGKTKKQLIYEEAAKLFQEKGYNAASMRDLAERVNLKASSLYSHIRRKEDILRKICFDNARHFTEGMEQVLATESDPASRVRALIRLHVRVALEDPTSVTVFNDEWKHLNPEHLKRFLELRRHYEQQFREIIKQGIQAGTFKSVDPNTALFTVLTSVRWLHYWHRPGRDLNPEQLEQDICRLLLSGLEK